MLSATRNENNCSKKSQKITLNLRLFLAIFLWTIFISYRREHAKSFWHQNNVRNVFSNIKLPLGYNIMTLEDVLARIWKEIVKQKKMLKKCKTWQYVPFWAGYCKPSMVWVMVRFTLVCLDFGSTNLCSSDNFLLKNFWIFEWFE